MQLVRLKTTKPTPSTPLVDALREAIDGEVRFDPVDRGIYANDASNYRHVPIGAVLPKHVDDVVKAVEICRRFDVPILGRGGGTSLAGQCTNEGVVFDFSKYMNRVLAVDAVEKIAIVEPGCVLDDLRKATLPLGLTFGPDPSTHDHCTLGGMIGNNACGVHALLSEFYGPGPRTEHNVLSLDVLTYDGVRMTVGPTTDADYERIVADGGPRAEIYRALRSLRDAYLEDIRGRFPDIPRRVSGYNLPALLPEQGFDLARALCGTESTCVLVLGATVKLSPAMPKRVLVVLGYPSAYEAADDIVEIRKLRPVGCEGIDAELVDNLRSKHLHAAEVAMLPEGDGWLLVEFGSDDLDDARQQAERCAQIMKSRPDGPAVEIIDDPAKQLRFWEVREAGLGATALLPNRPLTWEGWEDAAVPVERVGEYLRAFRALMDEFGYTAALYGHYGQGCIHCRIDFDLSSAEGIDRYATFTQRAAELVVRLGGSLSGEHGDGQARSDLLPLMFGPRLCRAFEDFKGIFDPRGRMNPGRIVRPRPRTEDLVLGPDDAPWRPATHFRYPADGGDFGHATLRCVGVGKCRRQGGGVMCPSYRVTREEMHSTRGRARLLLQMIRHDEPIGDWKDEGVHEALELCLACKGCKTECPANVDMATYKAEFLSHYYEGRLRPRHAYAFGYIDVWARLATRMPRLANFVAQGRTLGRLFKAMGGIHPARKVPAFAPRTFVAWFRKRERSPNPDGRPVILWPDTFNNHFFPRTLIAATEVLERAGCRVMLPPTGLCCGRPLYDFGFLDRAKRQWLRILRAMAEPIRDGIPMVGLEPSCVAAFRDELLGLFPDDLAAKQLSTHTFTLGEFLVGGLDDYDPPKLEAAALVQPHCHHHAIIGFDRDRELLSRMGLTVEDPDAGCCGMAGSFGFERSKYPVSVACGEQSLLPKIRAAPAETLVLADGFSCREQIRQGTDREPLHLAEVLQLAHRQSELHAPTAGLAFPERQLSSFDDGSGRGSSRALAVGAAISLVGLGLYALV